MPTKKVRVLSVAIAGGLVFTGVTAAVVTPGHAPARAALAANTASSPPVNLDNCPMLSEGYQDVGCVSQLQQKLTNDGDIVPVDGIFGPGTQRAVENFQQQHHIIPADGIVGPQTKAALDNPQTATATGTPDQSSPSASNIIDAPAQLDSCTSAASPNGIYTLTMQCDGNLVLIAHGSQAVWASNTAGYDGAVMQLQSDGNLVVYSSGHVARWSSGTQGHPGTVLAIQDDGNVVLVAPGNQPIWATDTVGSGDFVDTPMLSKPRHPVSFNLSTAASWAEANAGTKVAGQPNDPCTYFVSRAMREGGGMPTTSEWFPSSLSYPWNLVHYFVDTFVNDYQWARLIEINPRDAGSSGIPVEPDGSIANVGDIIYYQWGGPIAYRMCTWR